VDWLRLKEGAERIGVSRTTLHYAAQRGDVPFALTPFGHRLFLAADLDEYAEQRRHDGSKETAEAAA
jgi:excisionase family DNA binding protein